MVVQQCEAALASRCSGWREFQPLDLCPVKKAQVVDVSEDAEVAFGEAEVGRGLCTLIPGKTGRLRRRHERRMEMLGGIGLVM